MDLHFVFTAVLYQWAESKGSWVFVDLPDEVAEEIRAEAPSQPGFGSIGVAVEIGDSRWKTSIFPDKKLGTFVLPVKKAVRKAERIDIGDEVEVAIEIL